MAWICYPVNLSSWKLTRWTMTSSNKGTWGQILAGESWAERRCCQSAQKHWKPDLKSWFSYFRGITTGSTNKCYLTLKYMCWMYCILNYPGSVCENWSQHSVLPRRSFVPSWHRPARPNVCHFWRGCCCFKPLAFLKKRGKPGRLISSTVLLGTIATGEMAQKHSKAAKF